MAQSEVVQTLQQLPEPLRERARDLPVTYEAEPSPALQSDGIEPDTLGLFVGEEYAELGRDTAKPHAGTINPVFLDNLWDFAEEDVEVYREEVRATYLHELGHYLQIGRTHLTTADWRDEAPNV